jgi:hypothetical protein
MVIPHSGRNLNFWPDRLGKSAWLSEAITVGAGLVSFGVASS